MARENPGLSIAEAGKAAGVSQGSVRNWLASEAQLAAAAKKVGNRTYLDEAAVEILKKVRDAKVASASPALRAAWAARKTGTKPHAPKGPKAARKPPRKTGKPVSSLEAALQQVQDAVRSEQQTQIDSMRATLLKIRQLADDQLAKLG